MNTHTNTARSVSVAAVSPRTARLLGAMLLLTSLMFGAGILASPAGAQSQQSIDDPPPAKDVTSLSNLTPEEKALFDSGLPLVSNVDPSTGAVLDVKVNDRVQPMGVVTNNCSAGRACWYGWLSPHAYYGFDGSGAAGTWNNRGSFYTGVYTARPCWRETAFGPTICSEAYFGPNFTVVFGVELIGKRVYLI